MLHEQQQNERSKRALRMRAYWSAGLLLLAVLCSGCATDGYVLQRQKSHWSISEALGISSYYPPPLSERTAQVVRQFDLEAELKKDPRELITKMRLAMADEPSADAIYALGEIAYVRGREANEKHQDDAALDLYGVAVAQAYLYLFDPRYDTARNPYDPQFRRACDLYNGALEGVLRLMHDHGKLLPGATFTASSCGRQLEVEVVHRGKWRQDEIEKLEFVSDYQVQQFATTYRTYGLGVPLIAVRRSGPKNDPGERYLPPSLSYATTAFLRICPECVGSAEADKRPHRCQLELYDTVAANEISVNNRLLPLETDMTTPLAYYLDTPQLREVSSATKGFLSPEKTLKAKGIYMLEPYDPGKIPVIMVHGLWSSPLTWVEMFNDLRSVPEIRNNYQFWFYMYPSGQPFWQSAAQLRDDLAEARVVLDPQHRAEALDQMVLVGHSMGGLVSRLQTLESGNEFWSLVSDRPLADLKATSEAKEQLAHMFYFHPNPSIRRVITIATPFHGSDFANDTTRFISRKLIELPEMMVKSKSQILRDNPNFFKNSQLLSINTSVDSLAPDNPVFAAMDQAVKAPWVTYHNIVAVVPDEGIVGRFAAGSDGVVNFVSAHRDDVSSEKVLSSDHTTVHRTPGAVRETRRILRDHLAQTIAEWSAKHPQETSLAERPEPLQQPQRR